MTLGKITPLPGLFASALLALAAGSVRADELAVPEAPTQLPQVTVNATPTRGQSMRTVERSFGAPAQKYPAAGGDTPKHPPITRWDYPGFSVFFEHSHVVTSVVPGQPPQIYNTEQLEPAQ